MISVVDLGVGAHEPYSGVVLITLRSIAVVPFAVKLNQKPEMYLAVKLRITVDSHILDSCKIKKHLTAGIVNEAVAAVLCKASVGSMFVYTFA